MSNKFYNKPDPSVLQAKYTDIPNEIHDHPTLGCEAKTLLWTLFRYATCPNFVHHDSTIKKFMECGQAKLEKCFARAARAGFVHYEKIRGADGRVIETIRHFAKYPKWSRNGEGAYACALCADETCAFCKDAHQKRTKKPCETGVASTPSKTAGVDINGVDNCGVLINTDLSLTITERNNKYAHSANARLQFVEFYNLFPKKKDKQRALKAFIRVRETVSMETIMSGVARWRASDTPLQYWPLPSTWLNGSRWEDEMDEAANEKINKNFIGAI
ncbi:MAG: hypothetical protein V4568_18200 [Pseudomonadota bacterium]